MSFIKPSLKLALKRLGVNTKRYVELQRAMINRGIFEDRTCTRDDFQDRFQRDRQASTIPLIQSAERIDADPARMCPKRKCGPSRSTGDDDNEIA